MSNMSYCRFQNTLLDLRDCYDYFDADGNNSDEGSLSEREAKARQDMIELCCEIARDFGDMEFC